MAFVIEEIPEEMKQKFGKYKTHWVVDHEHNAFLVNTGSDNEFSESELHIADDVINIVVKKRHVPKEKSSISPVIYDIYIHFHRISIPKHLAEKQTEIKRMISDAFVCRGFSNDSSRKDSVIIENIDDSSIIHFV